MIAEPQDLTLDGWTLKVRVPPGKGPHPVVFMIHGWTGDERSMWVFAPRMPKDALLIAPRAPYVSKHPEIAGYSWVENRGESFSRLSDFGPALNAFDTLIDQLAHQTAGDFTRFGLIGFSQGAAFSAAYALRNRQRVAKLAVLAGFLAGESEAVIGDGLKDLPIFIAHGTKDETVPIEKARQAKQILEQGGAKVQYCESDTGHKLGANCSAELAKFFAA